MRGVLTKIHGVTGVEVEAGNPDIVVTYDSSKTDVATVLEGLKAGDQPAKAKS